MNEPLLSLVTITKDDASGLARTLASTAAWRALPWVQQIVVFADATEPAAQDAPIVWRRQVSSGIAGAFNEGIAQATGLWIWFVNSGDRIDERLAPEFLLALLRSSRAEVVIGGLTYGEEKVLRPAFPLAKQWPPLAPWIPHPATLVKKSLFDRFGRFDDRYRIAMDYEWWLRALGGDVRVDILAVPFTRFAPGGISEQPEFSPVLASERDDAIRRHQGMLWKNWMSRSGALTTAWARALFASRLGKRSDPR